LPVVSILAYYNSERNNLSLQTRLSTGADAVSQQPQKMGPSEALVETLAVNGVTHVFGIVGSAFMDALDIFPAAGIEFVFLKGTSQWPHFVADPRLRAQYDLDVLCPAEEVRRGWELLLEKGYEPLPGPPLPTDHLPTLIRKTGWQWRGDFYDPESPVSLELHFRLWDEDTERLRAPGVDEFWARRSGHLLDTADALGYACLHLLRHLLRGSLRPYHVYELAWFLEHHADDREFWIRWRGLHAPETRKLEAVSFRLAREWFGCRLGTAARCAVSGRKGSAF